MSATLAVAAPSRDPAALLRGLRDDLARAADLGERLQRADADQDRARLAENLADAQAAMLDELDAALDALAHATPPGEPSAHPVALVPRLLVVSASAVNRHVLEGLARVAGCEATSVAAIEEAEARLEVESPDAILVDFDAFDGDAVEATARLAARASGQIIGLTDNLGPPARERLRASGLAALLAAPVDPDALAACLAGMGGADEAEAAPRTAEKAPTFDTAALRDLEKLGGEDFARDIAAQFLADAVGLLAAIRAAAEACDEATFRDQTHALRSCAANVGARSIYQNCLTWRALDAGQLAHQGRECAEALERDYALVADRIGPYARGEAPLVD